MYAHSISGCTNKFRLGQSAKCKTVVKNEIELNLFLIVFSWMPAVFILYSLTQKVGNHSTIGKRLINDNFLPVPK